MRLPFRQGVVTSKENSIVVNGSKLNLIPGDTPLRFALADGNTDYLHTENQLVVGAWTIPTTTDPIYLFIDLDRITAARTFGYAVDAPEYGPTAPEYVSEDTNAPVSPPANQHWFNTSTAQMMMYDDVTGKWVHRLRVFVAEYITGNPIQYYAAGTQVSMTNVHLRPTGSIVYDRSGKAIRTSSGEFFTTESDFNVSNAYGHAMRLEAGNVQAQAAQNMAAFSVVKYSDYGKVVLANYEDSYDELVAITVESATVDEPVNLVTQGEVTNIAWDFTGIKVGALLWINYNGELSSSDPYRLDGSRGVQRVPVARVSGKNSIIFEQGMGGVGPAGRNATLVDNIPQATLDTYGIVKLSIDPPDYADGPVVVETHDTRMTNARPPLAHSHSATEIPITPINSSSNVQEALEDIYDSHVKIAGGTMTGQLNTIDPVSDANAANKKYVDDHVNGLHWLEPITYINLISDGNNTPPIGDMTDGDAYVVAAGGTGAWSGLDDHLLVWDNATQDWIDKGTLDDVATSGVTRFGIAFQTNHPVGGSFVGKQSSIAIYDQDNAVFTFEPVVAQNAVYIDDDSYHQWVYSGTKWVKFGGPSSLQPGTNVSIVGKVVNVVDYADGGTIDAKTLQGMDPADFDFAPSSHSHTHDAHTSSTPGLGTLPQSTVNAAIDTIFDVKAELKPYYYEQNDLPNASGVTGMIAYVEEDTSMFYSHDDQWVKLAKADVPVPYDMAFYVGSLTKPSSIVGGFLSVRPVMIYEYAPDSLAYATTPPDVNVKLNITRNHIQVGYIQFYAGANWGEIQLGEETLNAGDMIRLVTDVDIDSTISDITVTLVGCSVLSECEVPEPPMVN